MDIGRQTKGRYHRYEHIFFIPIGLQTVPVLGPQYMQISIGPGPQ
jgi:hypothetical protein